MSVKNISFLSKIRGLNATIGVFDGVHVGHKKILKRLIVESSSRNVKSLAVTFYPHPKRVLVPGSKVPFLTSLGHRIDLIESSGVDYVLVVKFTKEFSAISADEFIKKILVHKLKVRKVVVGKDFVFGHGGEGNFSLLRDYGRRYGFKVIGVAPVKRNRVTVSSTRIRKSVEKGRLKEASSMLGRPVSVQGTVIKGRSVGRELGFPTANIDPHHEAIPPGGVYAVDVRMKKKTMRGVLNIGNRPTFGEHREPVIELHIIKFKKNIYGRNLEIIFRRKIRNEKKFKSPESLREQIRKDVKKTS